MTRKPTSKEVRLYIRQEAMKAEALRELDAQLGDMMDLDGEIARRKATLADMDKDIAAKRLAAAAIAADNDRLARKAQEEAAAIVTAATAKMADAEHQQALAARAIDEAHKEAARLIADGVAKAKVAARDADGDLGRIQSATRDAEKRHAVVVTATEAVQARHDALLAKIAELKNGLAKIA